MVVEICDKLENLLVFVVVGIYGQIFLGGVVLVFVGYYCLVEVVMIMVFFEVWFVIVLNVGVI